MTIGTEADEGAFPTLSSETLDRIRPYGTLRSVEVGEHLFVPGDRDYDFFVILDGSVAIVQADPAGEQLLATHGAGRFLGELNMLTGSQLMVTARVMEAGQVIQISPLSFRRLLDREADLGRIIVDAFVARRAILQRGIGARSLQILGSRFSPEALQLRQFATRMRLPHVWEDVEGQAGIDALLAGFGVAPSDIPVVVTPTAVLRRPSPGDLAAELGLTFTPAPGDVFDVAVIGAGPAGLAAAVYAASEGLRTVVLDAAGPGGQAGTSSLIENYLGFPSGVSGRELTERAAAQAQKFGARINSPCEVRSLFVGAEAHTVTLRDGAELSARVVVVATGARYRRLPLPDWEHFEGAGIYYAATEVEARGCLELPVAVIGGGNSAGQAALFLAEHTASVELLVRRDGLAETMSRYLVDRIEGHPRITLRPRSQVTAVHGKRSLERIDVVDGNGRTTATDCAGLFCFIGASAVTGWLPREVLLDASGFVLTDRDLPPASGEEHHTPLPYESSVPGIFAAGDVRHGSMKRVASAVGEGAAAISSTHQRLALRAPAVQR